MKWTKPGHEFDRQAEEILSIFNKTGRIYVFGAGLLGEEMREILEYFGCFGGYVDNSVDKQQNGVNKAAVISAQEYMRLPARGIMLVCADKKNIPAITGQLEEYGLVKNKDYYIYNYFIRRILPVLSVYGFDRTFVELAQISVTERCTLKCKKCAHACPAAGNKTDDMTLEEICRSADCFFSKVDYIKEFVLIGGEPLLHKELASVIDYIGSRYRGKMMFYCITTNGTIVPNDDIIRACRKHRVMFRISNYTGQLPHLGPRYDLLVGRLEENGIRYVLGDKETEWFDYGFEYVDRDSSEEAMGRFFDMCNTPCREVKGNRFYFCVMAHTVSENMKRGIGSGDYLDLDGLTGEKGRKVFMEYQMGYSDKGYLDMCRHCNGPQAQKFLIPAAEQL